jgi:hypothetical protein
MVTSPYTTAPGAMNASGSIFGSGNSSGTAPRIGVVGRPGVASFDILDEDDDET